VITVVYVDLRVRKEPLAIAVAFGGASPFDDEFGEPDAPLRGL
jgi:hypothetical protein